MRDAAAGIATGAQGHLALITRCIGECKTMRMQTDSDAQRQRQSD